MTRLKTHFLPFAILVCGLICWLGMVDKADNVTHRVLELVVELDWSAAVGPFYMPFPIDAQAFRPLSVLGLKTYAEWFGTGHLIRFVCSSHSKKNESMGWDGEMVCAFSRMSEIPRNAPQTT